MVPSQCRSCSQLPAEDYDNDILGHNHQHATSCYVATTSRPRLRQLTAVSCTPEALSKSMLAEIKGIFTSCLRRITTTTSLGTTTNMQHRATWPQHHVHKLRQLTAVSCAPEALSKSMLAEIKGIFTSCLRRITTTTSLGTTINMQHRATATASRSQAQTINCCFLHALLAEIKRHLHQLPSEDYDNDIPGHNHQHATSCYGHSIMFTSSDN